MSRKNRGMDEMVDAAVLDAHDVVEYVESSEPEVDIVEGDTGDVPEVPRPVVKEQMAEVTDNVESLREFERRMRRERS